MPKTIVAEGVWCTECEFFEVEDLGDHFCNACGCHNNHHVTAEVVAEEK